MEPVRWGVLSVSGHYRLRLQKPLQESAISRMTAVASRDPERARNAAKEMGIPRSYGSYAELLKDPDIEAVYIPLPNHLHAEWTMKAADAGKHVLCEKPFGMNAAETEKAVDHVRSKGLLVMEAFMYKLHDQWRRAREIIRVGEIGRIRTVHTVFSYNNPDPHNIRNRPETGGGGIPDIGCYAVSAARFLTGEEPKRVVALIERDPAFRTDIISSVMLDFGGGMRSTFTVSTQSFPAQQVLVYGTGGTMTIHLPFNMYPDTPARVTVTTGNGSRTIEFPPQDQYRTLFDEFSAAVRGERELPVPPKDAVANMRVLDAIFASEKSGKWEVL
ncbi:Gfo/Idh/MocA family oxidoreductase [bacterium]|nr:Gfo/Idh/MocA family oxidoreductase [bacterium]